MESKTNRIQDLIRDRQSALKSQKELLDKYVRQKNDAVKGADDDIDKIVSNMLKECGLNETVLTNNDEQINGLNLHIMGNLGSEVSDSSLGASESNMSKLTGTVDINIVETSKDTFEKGIQADICANNQRHSIPENTAVNYNLKSGTGQNISLSLSIPTKQSNTITKEESETGTSLDKKVETSESSPSKTVDIDYNNMDVLKSSEFMDFFKRASRLIERALGEGAVFDPFFNIGSEINTQVLQADQSSVKNPGNISMSTSNGLLKNSIIFQHDSTFNRPVTCIRSHPSFPEYFIASYGNRFSQNTFDGINRTNSGVSLLEYGGCALIWSISTPNCPENTFVSPSPVLSVAFDPFCQFRYVGSSYNGEILIWDSRNGKIPFQKSNGIGISDMEGNIISSHSFPIYCMELLGNKGSQNIITIDIDGKLCNWNLTNLSEPVESFQLRKSNSKDISVQCMTLSKLINPNSIICGSEDGSIYQTIVKTNKPGTISSTFQNAHDGFITCLDYHPINDCFLSSSADWTIKLWAPNPMANSFTLLYTFESSENYVIGVSWHPIHPGIFAAIDADATLIIYNLTNPDGQTPLCKLNTSSSQSNTNTSDVPTCISWSNDGTRLFIGYLNGNIIMCNVDSKIYQPSRNVWDLFNQEIEKLKNNNSCDTYPGADKNESTIKNEENESL
ncbi:dynein intermediate chain 2 [Cryptosporidium bovis]|uniref:dynein intermediate chain 2 n=1 Tax=Cryptosporidium bovis TaxID=310047 RepID=UPI00351A3A09|nr:dynein intermediate chain 2 [Cryptosporidium bovis]